MSDTIKPDNLAVAIAQRLQDFQGATEDALLAAINETAEQAAEIVKSKAQHFGANYANDIKAIPARKIQRNGGTAYVTAGDHYRVAHLLEHGHAIVRGGRKLGTVKGYEHFKDGEDYAEQNIVPNLQKEMRS